MKRIMLAKTSWMKYYQDRLHDKPYSKGKYIQKLVPNYDDYYDTWDNGVFLSFDFNDDSYITGIVNPGFNYERDIDGNIINYIYKKSTLINFAM